MSSARVKSTRIPALATLPLAALWAATLAGCPFSPKTTTKPPDPPPSEYLPQISPDNVLANLRTAYEKENYDEYEKLFSEDYYFVFNPADVGDPYEPTPDQWFRADEMDSARNLFSNDAVEYITLSWIPGPAQSSDDIIPGSYKVRVDAVNLNVHTRRDGDIWILEVKNAYQVFYFREHPSQTVPSGESVWHCIRWDDAPIGGLKPLLSGIEIG